MHSYNILQHNLNYIVFGEINELTFFQQRNNTDFSICMRWTFTTEHWYARHTQKAADQQTVCRFWQIAY